MKRRNGILVISLDFEQYWGMRDKTAIDAFKQHLLGGRAVIPRILELFAQHEIHATWATVGLLFFESRAELLQGLPAIKPAYANETLSPYIDIEKSVGANEAGDPFHYAPSLIRMIAAVRGQEIATHTFSHYYCLEEGQNGASFKADLEAAIRIAKKYDVGLESLVFPKNQVNHRYLPICRELGIKAYRGNSPHWIHQDQTWGRRKVIYSKLRFLNFYFNLFGHNSYSVDEIGQEYPLNIRASTAFPLARVGLDYPFKAQNKRRLRRYLKELHAWELLHLRRIKSDLTYAARKGLVYHLWWHPHDFGIDQAENLSFLEKILEHYKYLQRKFGMASLNMKELSKRLLKAI